MKKLLKIKYVLIFSISFCLKLSRSKTNLVQYYHEFT
jgi:hypothetical protein